MAQSTISSCGSTFNVFPAFGATGSQENAVFYSKPAYTFTGAINNNYSIYPNQSGSLFLLPAGGGTVRLPSCTGAQGCVLECALSANADTTNAWTVASCIAGAGVTSAGHGGISGVIASSTGAGIPVYKISATGCIFANSANAGDWLRFTSTNNQWKVEGATTVTNGIS